MPYKKGIGMFAGAFMKRFPLLPCEDDGRLHDAQLRENFIERIFVVKRWQEFLENDGSVNGLVRFHTEHKLLIMAHSQKILRELGKLVAEVKQMPFKRACRAYVEILMPGLKLIATKRKNTNVLQHVMGYFKKHISSREKQELLEVIEQYHNGQIR